MASKEQPMRKYQRPLMMSSEIHTVRPPLKTSLNRQLRKIGAKMVPTQLEPGNLKSKIIYEIRPLPGLSLNHVGDQLVSASDACKVERKYQEELAAMGSDEHDGEGGGGDDDDDEGQDNDEDVEMATDAESSGDKVESDGDTTYSDS